MNTYKRTLCNGLSLPPLSLSPALAPSLFRAPSLPRPIVRARTRVSSSLHLHNTILTSTLSYSAQSERTLRRVGSPNANPALRERYRYPTEAPAAVAAQVNTCTQRYHARTVRGEMTRALVDFTAEAPRKTLSIKYLPLLTPVFGRRCIIR